MSDFPSAAPEKEVVRRAGKLLATELHWSEDRRAEILDAFRVAWQWRNAHAFPMKSVRGTLRAHMRELGIKGTTAARLKRMQAIRRKMRRLGVKLDQYQDLGGCRAILDSVEDARRLRDALRASGHVVWKENDYIAAPKADGYRGIHVILSYRGKGAAKAFDNRRIEVQLRTKTQHAWATAIEAVGLFRGEDLKSGKGDPRWLELFRLMSAEMAAGEGCPVPADLANEMDRVRAIRAVAAEIDALKQLDTLTDAVRWAQEAVPAGGGAQFYLLEYDTKAGTVTMRPQGDVRMATDSYEVAEWRDAREDRDDAATVLIEAEKIDALKKAFPNYFGNVAGFRQRLARLVTGSERKVFALKQQEKVRPPAPERPDRSWIKGRTEPRGPGKRAGKKRR